MYKTQMERTRQEEQEEKETWRNKYGHAYVMGKMNDPLHER